jgi:hypothetical protein
VITINEKLFSEGNDKGNMKQVDQDRWFNPAFQNFLNTEIVGRNFET